MITFNLSSPKVFVGDLKTEMDKQYFVYILASKKLGVLYVGVTNDLVKRVWQHKQGFVDGFSKKYKTHRLVYFDMTNDVFGALEREKKIKKWNRKWKIRLIEKTNPEWNDLYQRICS